MVITMSQLWQTNTDGPVEFVTTEFDCSDIFFVSNKQRGFEILL